MIIIAELGDSERHMCDTFFLIQSTLGYDLLHYVGHGHKDMPDVEVRSNHNDTVEDESSASSAS